MSEGALQQLLAVQDLDLAADQLRHRRGHLPELAELAEVDSRAAAIRAELETVNAALDDVIRRQEATEAELAATEERAAAVNQRLFGGEVSASRELQAMSAELDQLKGRASALEDAVLELLEQREPLEARRGELSGQLEALAAARTDLMARIEAAQQQIDAELHDVAARRDAAVQAVPEGLLATYERLRSRLGGIGVARLAGNRCDGCHLTLPAAELEQVRHLAEGQVYQCEQCSRILVP